MDFSPHFVQNSHFSVPQTVSLPTSEEHMMGTTIMAVKFDGGVVMGADSRTSTGNYVADRVSKKVSYVADKIFCCRSGSAADTQAINDLVSHVVSQHTVMTGEPTEVLVAAKLFQHFCYDYKDQLLAGIIVGGWDKKNGGSVYCVPLGGALVEENFAIGGSGSSYIYGFCDSQYRPNMTKEECVDFVGKALSLAMGRDGSSGGVARISVIEESGVTNILLTGNQLPFPTDSGK
eukprot:c8045_g1_i1.p1 GENE.c8045_g1_i1~~c8045_g1_i1.p1  ORF type:complete len:242 (-),score=107.71 c8045_g1_i1:5-703(-)